MDPKTMDVAMSIRSASDKPQNPSLMRIYLEKHGEMKLPKDFIRFLVGAYKKVIHPDKVNLDIAEWEV